MPEGENTVWQQNTLIFRAEKNTRFSLAESQVTLQKRVILLQLKDLCCTLSILLFNSSLIPNLKQFWEINTDRVTMNVSSIVLEDKGRNKAREPLYCHS